MRMAESAPGVGDHKDALYFSPHKFVGGPQTPGVLVVRRELARNRVPTAPGGGTIVFVDPPRLPPPGQSAAGGHTRPLGGRAELARPQAEGAARVAPAAA
jgi:selenocysteine lyase/cysteine desulfurase